MRCAQADKRFFALLKKKFTWEQVMIVLLTLFFDLSSVLDSRLWMIRTEKSIIGTLLRWCDFID